MTDTPSTPAATRSIERTFVVAVPLARAWQAQTDPAELANWFFRPTGEDDTPEGFDLYGTEVKIDVLDGEPLRWFRYSATGGPVPALDGYAETTVTFEEHESGTRITITRSGFG